MTLNPLANFNHKGFSDILGVCGLYENYSDDTAG